jgi:hypothetical protein
MAVTAVRTGRPSNEDLAQRDAWARQEAVRQLMAALRYLRCPSLLSATPICEREDVKRRAAALHGYRYPRAQTVIAAVRGARDICWAELGDTDDACYLQAIADALQGLSRRQSAQRAGVCETEVSKRRRKGVEIVVDHFLVLLRES